MHVAGEAATGREGAARILLVDDEEAMQTLLAYPLRKEGYEVVSPATAARRSTSSPSSASTWSCSTS